jgi:hypothetical protein
MGIEVTTDANTRYEDKSDARITNFNLSNVNPGDYLEVRGAEFPAGSNKLLATQIERRRTSSEIQVRGIVDSIARPALSILGITVQTTSTTVYKGSDKTTMTADAFFAAANGQSVQAKGSLNGTVFTATELELEHD